MESLFRALAPVAPALLVTVASLATVYCLRRGKYRALALKPWQNASLACFAVPSLLFTSWWLGLREPPPQLPNPDDSRFFNFARVIAPPSGFVPDETGSKWVAVGDPFPSFSPQGWLNGPAMPPGESKAGLTVVDVWNELCPVCHEAAPGLVHLREKWQERGVNFVGLTARNHDDAEAFVEQHEIAWPNGYGIGDLRDAAPQVFIVDRDGSVVWYDERLRYRHEPERLVRELDEAIGHALTTLGS
ncbi:MAG TPA: redoxin family protein [Pirellulales bacterium]|jgi:thiol-disulfide isomerase/thioredoxin|nr:redoxin family protein [Pirellulales bacterium]HEV3341428.1 redoxin family protein [Pirellulales bacterium]